MIKNSQMDRFEIIDKLYNFIITRFDMYHWKDASKYNYFRNNFARYDSYNDFKLCQEIILGTKNYDELSSLIVIISMIENIKIMDCGHMFPYFSHAILFDTDGSLIITNRR